MRLEQKTLSYTETRVLEAAKNLQVFTVSKIKAHLKQDTPQIGHILSKWAEGQEGEFYVERMGTVYSPHTDAEEVCYAATEEAWQVVPQISQQKEQFA